MIPFVQTEAGLMPAPLAKQLEDKKAAEAKLRDAEWEAGVARRAKALGLNLVEVMKLAKDPMSVLARAARNVRARVDKDTLEQAYPCRTCRVTYDEKYREACDAMKSVPCYVSKSFRGCAGWKPRVIVSRH